MDTKKALTMMDYIRDRLNFCDTLSPEWRYLDGMRAMVEVMTGQHVGLGQDGLHHLFDNDGRQVA